MLPFPRVVHRPPSRKFRVGFATFVSFASLIAFFLSSAAVADEAADREFFENRIRPLLVTHCLDCHSADSKKLGGGLQLDSRQGWKTGGDSGPAVAPGNPAESLLITAIIYGDESLRMPPAGKLPEEAIELFTEWVQRGAPDPRDRAAPAQKANDWATTLSERRDWWSLKPLRRSPPPDVAEPGWNISPVDRFVFSRLTAQGLHPAPPADPRTLARRLSLVVTGLPPTTVQLADFLQDVNHESIETGNGQPLPRASVERFVDRLLGSPHFGERWARHWMDVVRFTETHGNEWNYEVHHAWRYRDYLVRAFNSDLPFDQFVREHIAGDLLASPRWNAAEAYNESAIGTAFYRFGEANHDDCIALRQIGYDLNDNQIDTLTKAFQATTVACARCHDHKLDPVSMADYYGLLGMLRSSRFVALTLDGPQTHAVALSRLRNLNEAIRAELARIWAAEGAQIPAYLAADLARRTQAADAAARADGLIAGRLAAWSQALPGEPLPLENPLEPWRVLADAKNLNPTEFANAWRGLVERIQPEAQLRERFNAAEFTPWADFGKSAPGDWQVDGLGLRETPTASGSLRLSMAGEVAVLAVLPAGWYTNALSDRLNGTLRSPVLPTDVARISLQVVGQRSSAVRLVSSLCQLNYRNYRALTNDQLHWVTFEIPPDSGSLRTYAELLTMFDNPKFPDQLSALGGDGANYKLPWDKAAENPRSWFGITRVVLHDVGEPPRPGLGHLRRLFEGVPPANLAELAERYSHVIGEVIEAWVQGRGTDEEAVWLDVLVRRGLLSVQREATPKLAELIDEYRALEGTLALPRIAPGICDSGAGYDQPVFIRGESGRPGETARRRFLEVLGGDQVPVSERESGRLALAEQIASPENPLTARVFVNRVWHHLFGTGLVRTVDDFGHVGDLPSHPELLDSLAGRFIEQGWSVKTLIREIVLSRTFQLSHHPATEEPSIDPANRLLAHYPARRLEAEGIRDAILATSGRLDHTLYGPSVQPFREQENADRRLFPGPLDGQGRRSLYIKNNLMEAPRFLEAFDFPGGKVTQGRRDVTNVPGQALALLNDPFVIGQAEVWGRRLIANRDDSLSSRIQAMFLQALGRPPTTLEQDLFGDAVRDLAVLHGLAESEILGSLTVWQDLAHAMFNLQEFVHIP